MASGVRDLDQDPGHELARVDRLILPWLRRVWSNAPGGPGVTNFTVIPGV